MFKAKALVRQTWRCINKWMTFVSWSQTTATDSWTEILRVLVHTAIKRLPVINTSLLHMQSTHGAAHNNPGSKREGRERGREKKKIPESWTFFYIRDGGETMFCFAAISHYFYQPPAWVRHWGRGRREEGQEGEDFWKTLSHSLEWWHGSNETEERDTVL